MKQTKWIAGLLAGAMIFGLTAWRKQQQQRKQFRYSTKQRPGRKRRC